jgi:catalase
VHYQERVEGHKIRKRSESFADHFSQATLFWNSMADWEREHIVAAFRFELGKVDHQHIRVGVVRNLAQVDHGLAVQVAEGVGVEPPVEAPAANHGRRSPALSQDHNPQDTIATRKIAILVADGAESSHVRTVVEGLTGAGAICEVLAPRDGSVRGAAGEPIPVTRALTTVGSVLYDAVLVPGGDQSVQTLLEDGPAVHFVCEAFKHGKAVGALGAGITLLEAARVTSVRTAGPGDEPVSDQGVVTAGEQAAGDLVEPFARAIAAHRHHRRSCRSVPA